MYNQKACVGLSQTLFYDKCCDRECSQISCAASTSVEMVVWFKEIKSWR